MNGLARVGRALASDSRRAALLGALGIAVCSLARTIPSQVLRPAESPPDAVDGRDYDHLALNLARGRGFVYCWSDPEWRTPYERAENSRDYALHLALRGPCVLTARRAPGYPVALAAVYWAWGRSFEAGRLLSAVALALAGALGVVLAIRFGGATAGVLFALCFLMDNQLRSLGGAYMAEPIACLAVMAVLVAHEALLRNPRRQAGVLAGCLLGLLLLVRHHFFPLWAFGLFAATLGAVRSRTLRPVWVAYGVTVLLTFAPWGVRNCLVLDALMPLGTQGGQVLAGRYAEDDTGRAGGTWDSGQAARLWAKRQGKPGSYRYPILAGELRSSLAVEREFAMVGQEAAGAWLRRNWRRLPALALVSLRAHARGYGALGLAALVWGLAALAFPAPRRVAALGLVIVGMTALTVALTFEANGRYGAPVRPVAYLVGSLGFAASVSRLFRARRRPLAS